MPSRQSSSISFVKKKEKYLQLHVAVIQILKLVHTEAICNFRASHSHFLIDFSHLSSAVLNN